MRSKKNKLNTHSFSLKLSVSEGISSALRALELRKTLAFLKSNAHHTNYAHMDRLAGCNYYLDNGIEHFKYVASQTQNSLTFFKLRSERKDSLKRGMNSLHNLGLRS